MRLNPLRGRPKLRLTIAFMAIAMGVAMLGFVAYSYITNPSGYEDVSTIKLEPYQDRTSPGAQVDPLPPGGSKLGSIRTKDTAAHANSVFDTEYGQNRKHTVTITVRSKGAGGYEVSWRGQPKKESSVSRFGLTYTDTRVVKGALPIAAVVVQGMPTAGIRCTLTVDGKVKVDEITTQPWQLTWCVG